ncbi:MAG: hypothetical protein GVY18_12880, partial [Bacteroidetes bacterium]|nr:hypothetical protein [Bacteroidota bacterium]
MADIVRFSTSILLVALFLLPASASHAQSLSGLPASPSSAILQEDGDHHWDDRFFSPIPPQISALATDKEGHLYVGGNFLRFANVEARRIAYWDGTRWVAMGDGFEQEVTAIEAVDESEVYATTAKDVYAWNGSEWTPRRSADRVNTLAFDAAEGHLYVGTGRLTRNSQVEGPGLLRWDGEQWKTYFGSGMVTLLTTAGMGRVYAYGREGISATPFLRRWDPGEDRWMDISLPENMSFL